MGTCIVKPKEYKLSRSSSNDKKEQIRALNESNNEFSKTEGNRFRRDKKNNIASSRSMNIVIETESTKKPELSPKEDINVLANSVKLLERLTHKKVKHRI